MLRFVMSAYDWNTLIQILKFRVSETFLLSSSTEVKDHELFSGE